MDWIFNTLTGPVRNYLSEAFEQVKACEQNVSDLSKEMRELKVIRDDLWDQLDSIERQGEKPARQPQLWVQSVDELVTQAAVIEAQYEKRVKCMGDISLAVWSLYQLSKRAKVMTKDAEDYKKKRSEITNLIGGEPAPEGAVERPVSSSVGMDSVLRELLGYIRDENVSTIGVYGMGGVGKTELLSQLNNELLAKDLEYVIWIDMPCDANVGANHVQKSLFQRLGLKWDETKSPEQRARLVSKILSRSNFVLILDGVWEFLDLREMGIPVPGCPSKSKIILATRIEPLCDRMGLGTKKKVKVECLEWEDAWKLFADTVGEELIGCNSTGIRFQAKTVAKKCSGLPLALIHVGTAMRSKKTKEQWRHDTRILSMAPWRLVGTEVLSPLKLSLDKITDRRLRTCLLYCSLYPEDLPIHRDWVIDYCIGEGVLEDIFYNVDEMYSTGHALLGDLEVMSLLESCEDKSYIRIHPIIRGMVLWTVSECGKEEHKSLVRAGGGLTAPPLFEDWRGAERISLMRNDLQELSESPECPDLVTMLLQRNPGLDKICDNFFQSMVSLRVLDLSHTSIEELPAGIEVLGELRYLDLCGTSIRALPTEVRMLRKLRFLLLSFTSYLRCIPDGVIASLLKLQVLYLHASYGDWKIGSVGSGVNFDELNHLKKLRALGITIESVLALHRLLDSLRLTASIRKLHIRGCPGLTTIMSTTIGRNVPGLEWLRIADCDDLEKVLMNGDGGGGCGDDEDGDCDDNTLFPSLQTLKFQRLPKAKIIWDGGCVRNLCYLYIWLCPRMEQLFHCKDEEIEGGDGDENGIIEEEEESGGVIKALPNLKEMQLAGLPRLKSLRCGRRRLAFPCLEIVEVLACPKLKKLELVAGKLREVRGSKLWWDELEWNDDATKSVFAPLFKEKKLH